MASGYCFLVGLGPLLEEFLVRVTSARNKISHPDAFGRDRTLGKQSDAFCDVLWPYMRDVGTVEHYLTLGGFEEGD